MMISAVNAADNAVQNDTETIGESSYDLAGESNNGNDFYITSPENYTRDENTLNPNGIENYEEIPYDNKYYLFRGDCWTTNNNFESSATVTSETHNDLTVTGTFRTENDFVGLYWNSKDPIQHPYISYGNRSNYTDVTLEFDYEMTGCMDFSNSRINIVIAANTGETYFLTMNRFIEDHHVSLDFNNLTLLPGNSYLDRNGQIVMVGKETKLNVTNLKYIMLSLLPANFVESNSQYRITENENFTCKIFNITVANGKIHNEQLPLPPHQYRLCEGYDDIYNLNPMRISKEMRKLGYVEWVDLYVGASYFYEKSGIAGDVITDTGFNHNRTEKMVLNKNVPLNAAFRAWLDCYSRELKKNGVENLVISLSMENLQCPQSWRQMDSNGNFAMTGWSPSTFIYSPCHEDVIPYMQKVSEACLDIIVSNGFKPILQMGESWWWWNENQWPNQPPCFYDNSTKAKYLSEHGTAIPEYDNAWDSEYDRTVMHWLNQQLVHYSDALREVVKGDKYINGSYMALFFPPSVTDTDRVPPMIRDVNYLIDAYSPSKLDILQIEDYDWVTSENPHHKEAYTIGQELGFSEDRLHYFGGFVQNPEDEDKYWKLINQSMDDALEKKFKEVFVWAGLQVRRDNKIVGHDEDEILSNLTPPTVTSPDYVSVDEKFKITMHANNWINGTFNVYDYNNGEKGILLASDTIANGSSSVHLSSKITGLNKFYLDFDTPGGEYHMIEGVYVIENSKNITADIPNEVETESNVNITFKAPNSQFNTLSISVDGNLPNNYKVENGKFTTAISDLTADYHEISLKYNEGKLEGEIYSNTFTVNVGSKTSIEANNMTTTYNSNEKLVVTLKDRKGNAVKGKEIEINLNGTNHSLTTDDDGKATLTIDLIPGNYTAEIVFVGDGGYLSSCANASIIMNQIDSQITAPSISTTYNVAKNLAVTLKDEKGNVLAGQNVIVSLNSKIYNKTTDANGQIKISVNLPAKKYSAKITFAGSDIYKSSAKTAKVTVKKATPKLTASSKKFKAKSKTKKVTVTFKSNKNKLIKNSIIRLKVNKKTYKAKTNSKGIAAFNVKLTKKGKYSAVFKYAGNSNYNPISKKIRITVK